MYEFGKENQQLALASCLLDEHFSTGIDIL